MTSQERDDAPSWDADAFVLAAQRWLHERGHHVARGEIGAAALGQGATAEDIVAATMLSLVQTVGRHGAPVDPSDGDAVAAYTYKALHHRVIDHCRAAARRIDQVSRYDEAEETKVTALPDATEMAPLHDWMLDCIRQCLSRHSLGPHRDALFAPVAQAALAYLDIGAPADAPQPQTKGTAWTRAGWAALHSVDRDRYFPPEGEVAPNTLTQRRRAALDRARALLQDAVSECGGATR